MSSLAGKFLVAKTSLQDPSFRQSVVLLLQHGDAGAFGLVVNRAVSVEGLPFPVFAGGPCESQGLLMLHGHAEWAESCSEPPPKEVAPGIFLGDASCLSQLNDGSAEPELRYRIFSGYAGWGPGQLENELAAGAWAIVPAKGELLFDVPAADLWYRLAPPTIPEPSMN
jgi:putative transcriptional regulator